MNSKYLIIPDVHGRAFWKIILYDNLDNYEKIIFLGDYLDPYPDEGITNNQALANFKEIIEFAKNHSNVVLLYGNHDIFYINKAFECCRHDYRNYNEIRKIFKDNKNLFRIVYNDYNGHLFSHSGITQKWLDYNKSRFTYNPDLILESSQLDYFLTENFETKSDLWNQIGRSRGGMYQSGSPIWSDLRENYKDNAFPDLIQIFGHSQLKSDVYTDGNMWCLDCRKVFVLENNELKEYE